MFKLNENIIYYSYYLKDINTEDLVVEERIVDNDFEFEQTIPLLTTPCYTASCSLINDTSKSPSFLDPSIINIEEVVDDAFEQTKVLLRTPSKYKCKNRMMYTASPQKYIAKSTPTKLFKKIKLLQQKVRRQNKVINNLKDLLKNLTNKGMLNSEYEDILLDKFSGMSAELFKNQLKNLECKAKGRRYTTDIKEFALTLHYYSPKAYAFCRLVGNTLLSTYYSKIIYIINS